MGVYELVELRKPSHVVNEYVNLAKKFKMSKLVNAVLRQIVRDLENNSPLIPEVFAHFDDPHFYLLFPDRPRQRLWKASIRLKYCLFSSRMDDPSMAEAVWTGRHHPANEAQ